MTKRKHIRLVVLWLLCCCVTARGQELRRVYFAPEEEAEAHVRGGAADSVERVHGCVSVGGGVMSGWGGTLGFTTFSPEISYRVNDRLTVGGGFGLAQGFGNERLRLHGRDERSMAPRRRRGGSEMHVEGVYAVNDRLTVAASVFYVQGDFMPLLAEAPEGYALGVSAAMRYRLGEESYLSLYLEYVRSKNVPLLPYGGVGGWGVPWYEAAMPFACRPFGLGYGDF